MSAVHPHPIRSIRPPRPTRAIAVVIVAAWQLVLTASPANAYVRKRTMETFVPMFWPDPRLTLEVARPPDGVGVSMDDLWNAASLAAQSWSFPTLACTGVSLGLAPEVTEDQVAKRDGKNRIIMRVGAWCRDPLTPSNCELDDLHPPEAVALTTFFSRFNPGAPNDGQILEADIEINAVGDYQWGVIPDGPISGRDYANVYDLTSVLTHETGHFIGLEHTCGVPGAQSLIDDQGVPYPDCFDVPVDKQTLVLDATMYPFMTTADVKLRTLTDDDMRAACEIYPTSSVPWREWAGGGGCAMAPARVSGERWPPIAAVAALIASVFLFSRRRGRRGAIVSRKSAR